VTVEIHRPLRRLAGMRLTAMLLATALAVPLAAAAVPPDPPGPPGPHGPHGPGDFIARHADELGLDAATRQAIQAIVAATESRNRELRERIRTARDRLHQLLSQPEPDRDAVMKQASALDALMAQANHNRLDAILQIRARLSPTQREALLRMREEHRMGFHRGPLGRCADDLATLCPEAHDGAARLSCLSAHWQSLSAPCRTTFEPRPPGPPGGPPDGPDDPSPPPPGDGPP
jgi:Spy/CpxP family protein refolding chaperone